MVGSALKLLLSGNITTGDNPEFMLYELLGNNIFPNVVAQNYGTPAVVYTITSTEPAKIKYYRSLAITIDFDVDVLCESYSDLIKISTLIRSNLHRYKNSFNSSDSTQQGYGTPTTTFGQYAPPSSNKIQYVGGLQIVGLNFINSNDYYDEKLELYRNTLNFNLTYIDDVSLWGTDLCINLDDLNLMSTTSSGGNPLYTQPLSLNDGVNFLFCPSVYSNTNNVEATTLNGFYPAFEDTSGTSNTYRPNLKEDAKKRKYLEFGENKLLNSIVEGFSTLRTYKEFTIFSVFSVPNSTYIPRETAITFVPSVDLSSQNTSLYCYNTNSGGETGITIYYVYCTILKSDGSGGLTNQAVQLFNILKYPAIGLNSDIDFSEPVYFAFSLSKTSDTQLKGQVYFITSSDFAIYGNTNIYTDLTVTSTGNNFKDYLFNFQSLHSDVTDFVALGDGTRDMNEALNLYEFAICPEKLPFGSSRFLQIQKYLLEKNQLNKTS